jgi:hypothetical protein
MFWDPDGLRASANRFENTIQMIVRISLDKEIEEYRNGHLSLKTFVDLIFREIYYTYELDNRSYFLENYKPFVKDLIRTRVRAGKYDMSLSGNDALFDFSEFEELTQMAYAILPKKAWWFSFGLLNTEQPEKGSSFEYAQFVKGYLLSTINRETTEEADIYSVAFRSPIRSGITQGVGLFKDSVLEEISNEVTGGAVGVAAGNLADSAKALRLRRGSGIIVYRSLDHMGRPTGAFGRITPDMLTPHGPGTKASRRIQPPGYVSERGLARGHLIARQLGGSGRKRQNLVTLLQNPVNSPFMSGFEDMIKMP